MKKLLLLILSLSTVACSFAEDGYRLWLRYDKIDNGNLLQQYRSRISGIVVNGSSPTLTVAKNELLNGLEGLLDKRSRHQIKMVLVMSFFKEKVWVMHQPSALIMMSWATKVSLLQPRQEM